MEAWIDSNPHLIRLLFLAMTATNSDAQAGALRLGQAAEMLRVSVETLRRWEREGRIHVERSAGGQRLVPLAEVTRLAAERRAEAAERPTVARSARNTFTGIVTRIEADRVAAVVEVQAGPHRLVSLMTAEAVEELGLRLGDEAVCVVKATNVIVEVPARREDRP
jgi:molybdopterin-binding protein